MQEILTILENERIADGVYRMKLVGDTSKIVRPGQFVQIKLDGFFLRRPISVCDWTPELPGETGTLTLIYKTVGQGTDAMSELKPGARLDMLMGLGNGFDTSISGDHPLLVGGGVGTPPMYGLARKLVLQGKSVDVILGFNTARDVFYAEEFDMLNTWYEFGCEGAEGAGGMFPRVQVYIATVDGKIGTKGFVTDCLGEISECTHYYACGPLPMLKALKPAMSSTFPEVTGSLSFEERMGCGFGACVGCQIETKEGPKKVCTDGPVFESTILMI